MIFCGILITVSFFFSESISELVDGLVDGDHHFPTGIPTNSHVICLLVLWFRNVRRDSPAVGRALVVVFVDDSDDGLVSDLARLNGSLAGSLPASSVRWFVRSDVRSLTRPLARIAC